MAFVVSRPNGSWEVRESSRTPEGPRSRTLASFRELTPKVEQRVRERSRAPVDIEDLRRKASRAGAPVGSEADRLAAELLRSISRGKGPSRRLRKLLADDLDGGRGLSHELDRMKTWAGATAKERSESLIDLLGVGDALPLGRRDRDRFPRISSTR